MTKPCSAWNGGVTAIRKRWDFAIRSIARQHGVDEADAVLDHVALAVARLIEEARTDHDMDAEDRPAWARCCALRLGLGVGDRRLGVVVPDQHLEVRGLQHRASLLRCAQKA